MYPFNLKVLFLSIFFISIHSLFAGNGLHKHHDKYPPGSKTLVGIDSAISLADIVETDKSSKFSPTGNLICSCQILNMESSNYDHRYVVLLAEKANSGKASDFRKAKNRIQKEKKRLREMFYDRIQVVTEIETSGSCKSMFFRLKTANDRLQLYEILNADQR